MSAVFHFGQAKSNEHLYARVESSVERHLGRFDAFFVTGFDSNKKLFQTIMLNAVDLRYIISNISIHPETSSFCIVYCEQFHQGQKFWWSNIRSSCCSTSWNLGNLQFRYSLSLIAYHRYNYISKGGDANRLVRSLFWRIPTELYCSSIGLKDPMALVPARISAIKIKAFIFFNKNTKTGL